MGSSKNRWKITFSRPPLPPPPKEFVCPITQKLMSDPVIVTSGQTLERNCVQVCKHLNFTPFSFDFSTVIPNIAIKSTILNWCDSNRFIPPKPIDLSLAESLVRSLMASEQENVHNKKSQVSESESESRRRPSHFRFSSEESVASSSSTSEKIAVEHSSANAEEEKVVVKLNSFQVFQQEEAVVYLRHITRTDPTVRIPLCTPRLLSALRFLVISRNAVLQLNSIASLVNLSLEMVNKVKIVRSGSVPPLVEVLKFGFPESVEYSVSLIFSLALDDQNKTAIGVLGALPPLLNLLKSENRRVSYESLLALYHLSLVQSNQSKLAKFGAVSVLFGLMKSGKSVSCVMPILHNLAMCAEGRGAMLDADAVKWLVDMLKRRGAELVVSQEKCVEALYGLSCGSLRFRHLAKEAGALEVLNEVVERGNESVREKVKKMLAMIREGDGREKEEVEEVDWESLLYDSGVVSRSHFRLGYGLDLPDANLA
ncbi:hypothetical protein IFM89_029458 [Coptis chinensis]|uniref:RING-type E3 ubiquitin transferase n=1 Tax=Coptis chinensis TaxID=261450 RepID=A0A835HXY9_9MAGN|nr:hypothetical protein IFM89_029458 [Coptis chinensis]